MQKGTNGDSLSFGNILPDWLQLLQRSIYRHHSCLSWFLLFLVVICQIPNSLKKTTSSNQQELDLRRSVDLPMPLCPCCGHIRWRGPSCERRYSVVVAMAKKVWLCRCAKTENDGSLMLDVHSDSTLWLRKNPTTTCRTGPPEVVGNCLGHLLRCHALAGWTTLVGWKCAVHGEGLGERMPGHCFFFKGGLFFLGIFSRFFFGNFFPFSGGRKVRGRKEGRKEQQQQPTTPTNHNNNNNHNQQQQPTTTTTNNNNQQQPTTNNQQQQQQPTTTTTTTTTTTNNTNQPQQQQPQPQPTTTTNNQQQQQQPTTTTNNQPTTTTTTTTTTNHNNNNHNQPTPTNQPSKQPTNQTTNQPTN